MVQDLYVMRRANGDLLAIEIDDALRIPIWPGRDAVARYKALNPELALFWPVKLDPTTAKRLTNSPREEGTTQFLLLSTDSPGADLMAGKPVTLLELFPEGTVASS